MDGSANNGLHANQQIVAANPHLIGREEELAILENLYNREQPTFLALYGRRRVGKTYLINNYFRDGDLFFEITGSKKATKQAQLGNFHREFKALFPNLSESTAPTDWDEAFHRLNQAIINIAGAGVEFMQQRKVIIFLDELPWLASPNSGFLPALEYIWNRHFSRQNNLILIVCGSAASWMLKKVINNKAGLYGRLTRVLHLFPFNLTETEQFLAAKRVTLVRKQLVELYMMTGGVGAYLDHVQAGKSVPQIINDLAFKPSAPLFIEFNNLFESLFSESEIHLTIIEALAKKRKGMTQQSLLEIAGIKSGGGFSRALDELEASGFIDSIQMFGHSSKLKKYRLMDEYSNFYLSWIAPEYQAILRGTDPEHWYKIETSAAYNAWRGYTFENICFKHIKKIKQALGIAAVKTEQSYWQFIPAKASHEQGAEIDMIIDRADDCIHLVEIKFCQGEFVIDKAYAKVLRNKREIFRQKTKANKSIFITFITPFGVANNQYYQEIVQNQITLEQLF